MENFGKDFPAILRTVEWQRFSCHPWTEQKLYVGTLAKIFLPSLDWRTKALRGNFGKDFPAILGLTNKSSTWELWQRFSCHPWTDEQKLYVGTLAKIFLPSLDWRTKALRGNFGKDFPAILGLTNKSSTWELWQRFSCHPWTDEQKLYVGTLAKIFLPSLDWQTKALRGNFFPAILAERKIFLPSLDWRTKALRVNFGKDFPAIGKDFPAILGLTNKSSMWKHCKDFPILGGNLWQRFSCHPWTDEQKLYVGTLAKIFLPSLDWRTKALRGNFGKDFPAILGLMNKSSTWELWQRFSCHPWTDEQKLYVGTLAKIFLPSLDWRTKALRGNFGKDFPAILGLTNKSSTWELWQRFSCHPWTDEQKLYRGKALGKDFPAILGLTKSSTWELWQRFSCHPWNNEQKLYVGTLAKIFLPSLDWRTKALRGNFGKDFPAILGLTNKSSNFVGTLAKIFLPSLDWRTKALRGNFGKDFPAILGLTNKSSTWELWQRFSCHPWTDEQKLYVGTLAKIFLPSLDWRTKALRGNWELWQRFSCHPWTDERKLYMGTLAKIFLPSLDCRTKALRGNIGKDFPAILRLSNGKDFPAILGLSNKSSMWELWQRFSIGKDFGKDPAILGLTKESSMWETLAKIFLPSLDWRTKALRGNIGKDFPAILGLTNKSSTVGTLAKALCGWQHWQRFFLKSLDWRTKALCENFGKDFPAILGLTNKSSMWEHWQRFSCHPWTDEWQRFSYYPSTVEQKLYVRTLAKIFLPSLDWWMAKIFLPSLDWRTKSSMWKHWQRFSCHP